MPIILPEELREAIEECDSNKAFVSNKALREMREIVAAYAQQQIEGLKIYQPLPFQNAFHESRVPELVLSKANRVGGSVAGFAEVARAVTNQDEYGKYPNEGTAVCLGYGEGHIGRVIHKYLFRWGGLWMIKDKDTGLWRSYRPWPEASVKFGMAGDLEREDERRPGPPLIPQRFIKGKIAWRKASEHVFSYVQFVTGWELYAFNSAGEPEHAQGFACDLWHIDEDVARSGWLLEASNRLRDRSGKLRWTAMPHNDVDDLYLMIERAEEQEGSPTPKTKVIYVSVDDCPYVKEDERDEQRRVARSYGDEEYARRIHGRLIRGSTLMYPDFDELIHDACPDPKRSTEPALVQRVLMQTGGVPPDDWTRYFSIDPGFATAAGVFITIPPPAKFGNYIVVYDELYIQRANASIFAAEARAKLIDQAIRDFIFDFHGGNLRDLGRGELPIETYEKEFKKNGIKREAGGIHFVPGCDVIEARELAVREALHVRSSGNSLELGHPKLLIVVSRCPNLVREIKGFKRKKSKGADGRDVMLDTGNRKANTHAIEAMEQAVANNLQWVKPRPKELMDNSSADRLRAMSTDWRRQREGMNVSLTARSHGIVLGAANSPYN